MGTAELRSAPSVALINSTFAPFAVRFPFKFLSGIWEKGMGPSHPLPWVRAPPPGQIKKETGWSLFYLAEDMGLEPTGLLHLT